MKKIRGRIIVVLVVLAVIFIVAKNIIVKTAVSAGVKSVTGLTLDIENINIGIVTTHIEIEGMRLSNPPEFTEPVMVDIPEIYVDYNLGAFFKNKVYLEDVRLDLQEFAVVRNEKGELNLNALKVVQEKGEEPKPEAEEKEEKGKAAMPELQIDVLELKIGKVRYIDYSQGTLPKVKEYDVNIDERYENITSPYKFMSLIIVKALMNTPLANLADLDLGPLKDKVADQYEKAAEKTRELKAKTEETMEKTKEQLESARDKVRKDTAETKAKWQEMIQKTKDAMKIEK